MGILERLLGEALARGRPFIVVGGHAVAAHGYARQTLDLDLLVPDDGRRAWVEHLLALKLHVLRSARPPRDLKDLTDLVQLVEANRIDIRGDALRALCLKYATPEIHERIVRAFGE